MKITEVKSSDKQEDVVYLGNDAIVHLDEVIEIIAGVEDLEDVTIYKYQGVLIQNAKQYTTESLVVQAKKLLKKQKLQDLKVITINGNSFDGDESSRNSMMSAIQSATILNISEIQWKLSDNSIVLVGMDELKEALALSIQETGKLILEDIK